ncbi:MAG: pyridoxal-phosphate dependent enzyme [Alphaproteobacteria bacterium]
MAISTRLSASLSPANESVLDLIGNTPMVRVRNLDTGPCELFLKLESQNPGGSIKDRIALSLVTAAEQSGALKPGGILVEATAGNTGLGLALIASQKGYGLKLVIPDKMSQEKVFHLKALGAEVILTRSDVGKGHPDYYQDRARRLAEETPGAFYVNQFENPANPATHENGTGPEIWAQLDHRLDAVVCGVGSGGTLTGLGRFFARVAPHVEMILADPKGSILAPFVEHGVMIEPGSWLVEGIGEDFIPKNCELSFVKRAYTVTDAESIAMARETLRREGILCGSSSGTMMAAALRYCRAQTEPKRVVSFVCDSGNKYLSKIYNEYWLDDQGFVERVPANDLRDLIARPYLRGQAIIAAPDDALQQVYAKMKTFDISQLPVMEHGGVVGMIDEMDILMTVTGNDKGFAIPARTVMSTKLVTLEADRSLEDLAAVLARGLVGCIMDKQQFLGLITPADFLNYLRKRTGKA